MTVKDITDYLSAEIPLALQEDYDNAGLQVGDPASDIDKALLTLDVTDEVINEAVDSGTGLIISHHPLIFKGIKKLVPGSQPGNILIKAVNNGIAVYSAHTNLDNMTGGVSYRMADKLGLENVTALAPMGMRLLKIVVFIPSESVQDVRTAMYEAGAGSIGKYDRCSFNASGYGTYRAGTGANPYRGSINTDHREEEMRVEMIMPDYLKAKVLKAMTEAHPYEEVAYDIYRLENDFTGYGTGCIGLIGDPLPAKDFLEEARRVFDAPVIKYSGNINKVISKVAVCGGAGAGFINKAMSEGADIFITGDIKYHSFFEAGDKMIIADIGHYESEKCSLEILYELITKKFPKFAVRFSKYNTNPINYL